MKTILAILHASLVGGALLPVFSTAGWGARPEALWSFLHRREVPWYRPHAYPLEEASRGIAGRYCLKSVVAAGLPAFLALMNLPLILRLQGETGDRWRAFSSLLLGFLSTLVMFELLLRYGYGRLWGGYLIWLESLLLLIAGTAATARLRPVVEPPAGIRST